MKKLFVLLTLIMLFVAAACSGDATQVPVPLEQDSLATPVAEKQQVDEVGSAPTAAVATAVLPILAPAPAWNNDVWINSEAPLPLEDLRGKVVLLEFWTFG